MEIGIRVSIVTEDGWLDGNRLVKRDIATSVVYEVEHRRIAEFSADSVSYYIRQGAAAAQVQFCKCVAVAFQSLKIVGRMETV